MLEKSKSLGKLSCTIGEQFQKFLQGGPTPATNRVKDLCFFLGGGGGDGGGIRISTPHFCVVALIVFTFQIMSSAESRKIMELGDTLSSIRFVNSVQSEKLDWQELYIDHLLSRIAFLESKLCTCKRVRFSSRVQIWY